MSSSSESHRSDVESDSSEEPLRHEIQEGRGSRTPNRDDPMNRMSAVLHRMEEKLQVVLTEQQSLSSQQTELQHNQLQMSGSVQSLNLCMRTMEGYISPRLVLNELNHGILMVTGDPPVTALPVSGHSSSNIGTQPLPETEDIYREEVSLRRSKRLLERTGKLGTVQSIRAHSPSASAAGPLLR